MARHKENTIVEIAPDMTIVYFNSILKIPFQPSKMWAFYAVEYAQWVGVIPHNIRHLSLQANDQCFDLKI